MGDTKAQDQTPDTPTAPCIISHNQPTPIDAIHLNDRNPRSISKEAFAKLRQSIDRDPAFMRLRPIVIAEDGEILGGNMRYRACLANGMTELPPGWVVQAANLTPDQRRRFILVDNAPVGMSGDWDWDMLANEWDMGELDSLGFDLAAMGDGETPEFEPVPEEDQPRLDEKKKAICPECGHEFTP